MRKNIFLVLGLLVAFLVEAQMLVGPKVGFLVNSVFPEEKDSLIRYELRPGFQLGAALNYEVTKTFSLQAELMYSFKGKKEIANFYSEVNDRVFLAAINTATYHFIDVPVLLRLTFGKSPLRYYVNVGPNFGYWLAGHGKLEADELYDVGVPGSMNYWLKFSDDPYSGKENQLVVTEANRLQVGLDVGFGFIFQMLPGQVGMVDFRYSFGHTYYSDSETAGNSLELNTYNESFKFSHGVFAASFAYFFEYDLFGKRPKKRNKRASKPSKPRK